MDTHQFVQFLLASILLTLSPGPDILYVLTTSLRGGFKRAFFLAAGLCSGLVIHTALVGFGVAQLISSNEWMLWGIKGFGAMYMLYLAFIIYNSTSEIKLHEAHDAHNNLQGFYLQGFLMNVLNPKVSLFFLAFLPQFINYDNGNVFIQALFLGALFFIQAILIFSFVAHYASKISSGVQGNPFVQNLLKYVQIGIFIFLAISILFL